ncbi:MAG: molybdopterin-dependent oxidoreductase [Actinobacteria bacterium]|nr:molybdopterin-dependent oxidoreductase [Actinomycetota bacterium]
MARLAGLRLADLDRKSLERYDPNDDDDGTKFVSEIPEHAAERVPPGQRVTRRWPVLHEGRVPRFDSETWRFEVRGSVEEPIELTYDELRSLPAGEVRSDFHCVTGWSKLDNVWTGVPTKSLLGRARPLGTAAHVSVVGERNYTANVPLEVLSEDDAILAWGHNGEDLAPKHGHPLRLVVPNLYGWKSVKWARRLDVMDRDKRGYWEVRGYHNRADPWREERYSYQELS